MKAYEQAVFRFGQFTLVPSERLLLRAGKAQAISGKAFDLLVALVSNAGHLMSKDELLRQVWPGLVVEEVNLSVNASAVRKVLSADPLGAQWIETVPRQGYRFNAPVEIGDVATIDLAGLRGLAGSYRQEPVAPARRDKKSAGWLWAAVVAALLVVAGVVAYRYANVAPPYRSVAILPFSADAANTYLADGLAESVIQGLTQVRSLRVAPRASAFRYKGATQDPIAAARALGADAVVTAALVRSGANVRVTVELRDVARATRAWHATYEVSPSQLPQLEVRMREELASALRVRISGREAGRLARVSTGNADAYQEYLQGRFRWNQRSEAALLAAIEHFRRAISMDERFALAYAALADAYTTLGYLGYVTPVSTFPVARPFALRALELDPSLAQAHASLAYIKFYFDWDWAGAGDEFRKALALDPNDPVSHQWHAVYLLAAGHSREAFGEIETAHRLDPLSLAINTDIGFHHYYNGRYPEAVAQLKTVLGMKSDFLLAHLWLARTYLEMGRYDQAIAATQSAEAGARPWPVLLTARAFTYATAGRVSEAKQGLREMEAVSRERFVTAYGMALVHAGLTQREEAFAWLGKAFDERSHWLVWLRLDPRWKSLRDDPRFEELVARMKYPAATQ